MAQHQEEEFCNILDEDVGKNFSFKPVKAKGGLLGHVPAELQHQVMQNCWTSNNTPEPWYLVKINVRLRKSGRTDSRVDLFKCETVGPITMVKNPKFLDSCRLMMNHPTVTQVKQIIQFVHESNKFAIINPTVYYKYRHGSGKTSNYRIYLDSIPWKTYKYPLPIVCRNEQGILEWVIDLYLDLVQVPDPAMIEDPLYDDNFINQFDVVVTPRGNWLPKQEEATKAAIKGKKDGKTIQATYPGPGDSCNCPKCQTLLPKGKERHDKKATGGQKSWLPGGPAKNGRPQSRRTRAGDRRQKSTNQQNS